MQTYLGGYSLYDFNRQKAFSAKYMAENSLVSQKHQKHDGSNVKHRGNLSGKG